MDAGVSRLEQIRARYNELSSCQHEKQHLTATLACDGSKMYANQCETCGQKMGNWIPHAEVRRIHTGLMNTIPEFDRELAGEMWRERSRLRDEMIQIQNIGNENTGFGIPTNYKGYRFRSRIEATWAAFMDLLGWKWEYEPFDLLGYIPDFVITGNNEIIVEVKHETMMSQLEKHQDKIDGSGWEKDAIIVGATPLIEDASGWDMTLGRMRQRYSAPVEPHGEMFWWGEARWFECRSCNRVSFHHTTGSFVCNICGYCEGDHHLGPAKGNQIQDLWASARNQTQWMAR